MILALNIRIVSVIPASTALTGHEGRSAVGHQAGLNMIFSAAEDAQFRGVECDNLGAITSSKHRIPTKQRGQFAPFQMLNMASLPQYDNGGSLYLFARS
jgi:hypothetical protein